MGFLLALLAALIGLTLPGLGGGGEADGEGVTISLEAPPPLDLSKLPRIYGARGTDRPLVVLDAGHGGRDPGATSPFGNRLEKDVTLAIAAAIRDELAASGRVRVAMTREDDRYLVLRDRYEIARAIS